VPAHVSKKSAERARYRRYTSRSRSWKKPTAVSPIGGSTRKVWTVTAASHPDESDFFTPNDDSGSMNEPASPTRSSPGRPKRVAV
jgi:hypothetical protein